MIKFKVEYYNSAHKKLLSKLSCASELENVVKNGLEVSEQEFYVYSLFREQKDQIGFRTYQELKEKVKSRLETFHDYFSISSGSIKSIFSGQNNTDKTMTEAVGIGASLSLASKIYGLSEADWEKIPIAYFKDLDFKIAATDNEMVLLESKGAVVADITKKAEISKPLGSINKKKEEQRNNHDNKNTLLGIITSIPTVNGSDAVCRILDPHIDDLGVSPRKYKLLARLSYYYRELRIISKAPFLIALINRIKAIQDSSDYNIFDGKPLINIDNKPFTMPPSLQISKSVVDKNVAFGEIIPMGNRKFYYYGFLFDVISVLTEQRFSNILDFRSDDELLPESIIDARIRRSEARFLDIEERLLRNRREYFKITMLGKLFVTKSGKVLGPCCICD